jgi:Protein of unknown function (DUF2726)
MNPTDKIRRSFPAGKQLQETVEKDIVAIKDGPLPYRLREHFLSTTEIALFHALVDMVQTRYLICPKVALIDIFLIIRPNENVHYFNKIFRKHVDFLLCNPRTFKPEMGIELVKQVSKSETRTTDQFMQDLFLSAGLPLVHVLSSDRYEIADLISLFQLALLKAKKGDGEHPDISGDSVPMCPVCGKMMVLRTYRSGPQSGQVYYGCIDNPGCPGTLLIK